MLPFLLQIYALITFTAFNFQSNFAILDNKPPSCNPFKRVYIERDYFSILRIYFSIYSSTKLNFGEFNLDLEFGLLRDY